MSGSKTDLTQQGGELLSRLLAILPARGALDWRVHRAARWMSGTFGGRLVPFGHLDPIALTDLLGIDDQKGRLVANTEQFLAGHPANNALLWGARGTGKSSLLHALLNRYADEGLRLIEVDKESLVDLAAILELVDEEPYRFLLVCDDLSFEPGESSYKALKSALEGSVFATAENTLIYATSNRRHLLPEYMTDNTAATHVGGELHEAEVVEEKISLSDRFGLWLSFHAFRQDEYLAVARHWLERIATERGLTLEWNDERAKAAIRWALARGVRSGRTARHFATNEVGAALLADTDAQR